MRVALVMGWCCALLAGAAETPVAVGGAEGYKLTCRLVAEPDWPNAASAEVVFDQSDQGEYAFVFTATEAQLVRRQGDQETVVARTKGFIPMAAAPLDITVGRERWRKRLIVGGQVVLTAFDDVLPPGEAVLRPAGANLRFDEPAVQPTESVYFADDFMRNPDDPGGWSVRAGKWELSGVSAEDANEKGRPLPNLSSNPFAYRATETAAGALATAGFWFWDTYSFEASVRAGGEAHGQGALGLCFYVRDPRNYLALRWYQAGVGSERRLVAVVDGQEQILAAGDGGWGHDQWYRLGVTVVDGQIEATLDGELILTAESPLFGQGEVGLWADGVTFADFDDLETVGTERVVDGFGTPSNGRWEVPAGRWQDASSEEGPTGRGLRRTVGGDFAAAVAGDVAWRDYEVSARVKIAHGSGAGLLCGYQDPGNYLAFRLGDQRSPGGFRNQMVKASGGTEQVIVTDQRYISADWHELKLECRSGFVRAYVDGTAIWEIFDAERAAGKAGIVAMGEGVEFDRFEVSFLEPERPVEFTEQFSEEQSMSNWAAAEGSWYVKQAAQRGGVTWHRGDFYGDPSLAIDAAVFEGTAKGLRLILDGDGANAGSGHALVLMKERDDSKVLRAQIQINGQPVRDGLVPLADLEVIRFVRRGWFLMGYADETCFVTHLTTPQTLQQGLAAGLLTLGGWTLDLGRVNAWSDHLFDTTFVTAPWEFHAEKGIWETINRWKCDPRWSFFGGYDDKQPLIWSKDDYAGDIRLEAYMAIKMDSAGGQHYLHPSDLCLSICGDGREVDSGYTFLFAGRRNTTSMLFRRGDLIAENSRPEARFLYTGPGGEGLEAFHRHWFHVVLRKSGGRLQCSVDDQTIIDVVDPEPLPGGKIALYSVNNGVMVARAKVWYEQEAPRQPFVSADALLHAAEPPRAEPAFENDFESTVGAFRAYRDRAPVLIERDREASVGRYGLKLTNLTTGGDFAVRAVDTRFQVSERPLLKFRYRIPAGVRVNVYVRARGLWHQITLTGADEVVEPQRLLGSFPDARADGRWHPAQFDLLKGFGGDVTVEQIVFAMWEKDEYLHAGFGVNPLGASWWLDAFSVGPN